MYQFSTNHVIFRGNMIDLLSCLTRVLSRTIICSLRFLVPIYLLSPWNVISVMQSIRGSRGRQWHVSRRLFILFYFIFFFAFLCSFQNKIFKMPKIIVCRPRFLSWCPCPHPQPDYLGNTGSVTAMATFFITYSSKIQFTNDFREHVMSDWYL